MKKSIFAIALMASLLASADTDSYLYWMVNVENNSGWQFDYSAQVRGVAEGGASTTLSLYDADGYYIGSSVTKGLLQDYQDDSSNPGFYALLSAGSSYKSYVIELLSSDSGQIVGSHTVVDITDVIIADYITQGGIGAPKLQPLTMNIALQAPEPSSGLLLLLGVVGLALRRRKQVAA